MGGRPKSPDEPRAQSKPDLLLWLFFHRQGAAVLLFKTPGWDSGDQRGFPARPQTPSVILGESGTWGGTRSHLHVLVPAKCSDVAALGTGEDKGSHGDTLGGNLWIPGSW